MKHIAIVILLMIQWLFADLKSTTGTIGFDTDSDDINEITLGSNGLGIATVSPGSNLHVIGNAAFENGISIATTATNSSIEIGGSLGVSTEIVSSNVTIDTNSFILADSSNGNVLLTLPDPTDPVNIIGRQVYIKKISALNKVIVIGGGNIDNLQDINLSINTPGSLPHLNLIAGANQQWYITSISGNSDSVSSDNLVGWWKLDETSDGKAFDSSSHANHGTLAGGLAFSGCSMSGKTSNSLSFDGSNDYITIGNQSVHDFTTGSFSLCAWARATSGQGRSGIIEKRNSTSVGWRLKFATDNKAEAHIYDGTSTLSALSTNDMQDGQWHHYVGLFEISGGNWTAKLYVDGDLEDTKTGTSANSVSNGHPVQFGVDNNLHFLNADIDDIRIYNKTLSAGEIQALFQLGI